MSSAGDLEFVTPSAVVRRVVVGDLATNCWIIACATTRRCVIIDPGDEPQRVAEATDDFVVEVVLLTHSHWDHVLGLPTVADQFGVSVCMHADDEPVWPHEVEYLSTHGHFDAGTATGDLLRCGCQLRPLPDVPVWTGATTPIDHGQRVGVGDIALIALHTPGHTPGGVSYLLGDHLFSGDTLFPGGPGLTGWPLSDFDTIINSITTRLFTLPDGTAVHPGHGRSTTIAAERPHLGEWIDRGW